MPDTNISTTSFQAVHVSIFTSSLLKAEAPLTSRSAIGESILHIYLCDRWQKIIHPAYCIVYPRELLIDPEAPIKTWSHSEV